MISVLIPVYNNDISQLVYTLQDQFRALGTAYELVLIDDHSAETYTRVNRPLQGLEYTTYIESPVNKGRTATRLELAKLAKYPWLLFLDSDSIIVKDDFIKCYCQELDNQLDVIIGGRIYPQGTPKSHISTLHWKYGFYRESRAGSEKYPFKSFMSNNFLIRKEVFLSLRFYEQLEGYGHEDTLMGIQMESMGARLKRLNNYVLHNGVESVEVYLEKTRNALLNLTQLTRLVDEKTLRQHVTLFRAFTQLKRSQTLRLYQYMYALVGKRIERNLKGSNPSLFYFDLFKLNNFIALMQKEGANEYRS